MDNPFNLIGPQIGTNQPKDKDVLINPFSSIGPTPPQQKEIENPFKDIGLNTDTFSSTEEPPYWQGFQFRKGDDIGPLSSIGPATIVGNKNWQDNFAYGFKLGIKDTYRGVKQMANIGTDELRKEQEELRARIEDPENGVWTMVGYFGGAILDPITWLIPFAKAKTIYSMAKMGAVSGGVTGALGYVDEQSILDTRTKQALAGGVGGAIIAPAIGLTARGVGRLFGKEGKPTGILPEADVNIKTVNESSLITSKIQGAMGEKYRNVRIRPDEDIEFTNREIVQQIKDIPKGNILTGPRAFFDTYLIKPYQEKIGKPGFEYLSTGKFGPDIVTGTVGAAIAPQYLEDDAPMTQKFSAAALGFLSGFAGVQGLKQIPIERTFLRGTKDEYTKKIPLSEVIARGIVDDYGLPADVAALKSKAIGKQNEIAGKFVELAERAQQLSSDERRLLLNLMEGDIKYGPTKIEKLSDNFRKEVKILSQMFVDFGLLSEETVKRNIDRYLRRTYTKDDALAKVGDELKPRGIVITVPKGEYLKRFKNDVAYYIGEGSDLKAIKQIQKIRFETPEKINSPEYNQLLKQIETGSKIKNHVGWELFDLTKEEFKALGKNDSIKIRWELTKQERIALGEIEDGALAISETGRILSGQLGKSFFYNEIAKTPYAYTKPTVGEIGEYNLKQVSNAIIPDTGGKKRFGPLAGKWIPEDIYDNLIRTDNYLNKTPTEFYKGYRQLNQLWKISKTAWNPTVHVNNTISNVVLYDLMDGSNLGKNLSEGYKALTAGNKGKKSELFTLAEQNGVLEADFISNELKAISQVLKDNPYTAFGNKAADEFNQSVSSASIIFNDLKRSLFGLKTGAKFATDLYRFEDSVFRLAIFRDRLSKGFSTSDAAIDARRSFIDYDINAPVINFLREYPTPFLAYTYRVVPLLAETAVVRPWKYAKWAALGYGLNKLGGYYSGGDEVKERALMSEQQSGKIFGVPLLPHRNIKLPVPAELLGITSKPYYLDITRYVPGGDVLDVNSFTAQIPGLPASVQPSLGLLGDIIPPMFGYDVYKKEKLKGLGQSLSSDLKIKLDKVVQNLIPNFPFAPGSYTTQRIERARKGIESPFRTDETELGALIKGLGFKINQADLDVLSANKVLELKKRIQATNELMAKDLSEYRSGKLSYKEFETAIQNKSSEIAKLSDSYSKKLNLSSQKEQPKTFISGLLALPGEVGKYYGLDGLPTYDETSRMLNKSKQQ